VERGLQILKRADQSYKLGNSTIGSTTVCVKGIGIGSKRRNKFARRGRPLKSWGNRPETDR
jgi:hypothetical protein